jgi:hypothetical protein
MGPENLVTQKGTSKIANNQNYVLARGRSLSNPQSAATRRAFAAHFLPFVPKLPLLTTFSTELLVQTPSKIKDLPTPTCFVSSAIRILLDLVK